MGRKETKSIPLEDQRKTKQPSRKQHRTKSLTDVIVTNHLKFNKPVADNTQGKVKKKKEALEEMVHKNKHRMNEMDNRVTEEKLETLGHHGYKRERISAETEGPLHDKNNIEDENKGSYIKHDNKLDHSKHTHENIGDGENEKEKESTEDEKLEKEYDSEDKGSSKEQKCVKHEVKSFLEKILEIEKSVYQLEHLDIGEIVDEDVDGDAIYLEEDYEKQKNINKNDETGNKSVISKMFKMQVEQGDSEKSAKNGKDFNDRISDKSGKEMKERKNMLNISSVCDTDKHEKPVKQTVDLPPDDNRYR